MIAIKDFLYAAFSIGVFIIGIVIGFDILTQARNWIHDGYKDRAKYIDVIRAKDATIRSMESTINAQKDALNFNRDICKKLRKELEKYTEVKGVFAIADESNLGKDSENEKIIRIDIPDEIDAAVKRELDQLVREHQARKDEAFLRDFDWDIC